MYIIGAVLKWCSTAFSEYHVFGEICFVATLTSVDLRRLPSWTALGRSFHLSPIFEIFTSNQQSISKFEAREIIMKGLGLDSTSVVRTDIINILNGDTQEKKLY